MRAFASLDKPLAPKARAAIIRTLCRTFARAFDVKTPRLSRKDPDEALRGFREFSAACMEAALVDSEFAGARRDALEREGAKLGKRARALLAPHEDELMALVAYLYEAIGIDVTGSIPGELTFHRCYFSERYSPGLCALMSGFDSGLVGGICGGGSLAFHMRITEGAPCCRAICRYDRQIMADGTAPATIALPANI